MALTASQQAQIQSAIDLMDKGSAYQTPFSEDVISRVAQAAASSGFLTTGAFYEQAKLEPIATLLKFLVFVP